MSYRCCKNIKMAALQHGLRSAGAALHALHALRLFWGRWPAVAAIPPIRAPGRVEKKCMQNFFLALLRYNEHKPRSLSWRYIWRYVTRKLRYKSHYTPRTGVTGVTGGLAGACV